MKELRMLSNLHGIGCIELNIENPAEGKVIIPAKEKEHVDWESVNRLADENKDFEEYLELINTFYKTNRIKTKDWDHQPENNN